MITFCASSRNITLARYEGMPRKQDAVDLNVGHEAIQHRGHRGGTEHALDRRRVYLFGFSAGSGFAINMSLLQSEYFAATAAYASISFKEQFAEIAARKIPFSFTVGVKDEIFPVADARAGRDGLRARGFPVEWKEIAGAGHDYATNAAAINQAAWEFFQQHQLAVEPQYRDYQFRK